VKSTSLVGIAMVAALVGASAIRTVTAQGKEDQARQARDRYEDGVRAYEGRRFEEAVNLMNAAIKLDDKERIRGRVLGYDYFPYFYLGQALRELGRCGPALDAWEASHRQELVIKRERHHDAIQEGYRFCVAKGFLLAVERNGAHERVDKILSEAEQTMSRLRTREGGWSPELKERLAKAQFGLNDARLLWRSAANSRLKQQFDDAQRRAEESQRALVVIESDSLKPVEPVRRDAPGGAGLPGNEKGNTSKPLPIPKELVEKADDAVNRAQRRFAAATAGVGKLAPEAASAAAGDLTVVATGLEDWRRELKAASDPPDLERYTKAAEMPPAVRSALNRLGTMLVGGPPPLSEEFQTGAELFFTGRYEQAVSALADDGAAQVPEAVRPDFYALRAAANFALYERSGRAVGRESESRKIMAIEDVKQCKRLKPDFRPRQDTFSPRFIEFFDSIPR
jgi:hypothetical protein